MCVVSMIMTHYGDEWQKRIPGQNTDPLAPFSIDPTRVVPLPITPAEIEEFRRLLERAREYDRAHNEPDCELEEKRTRIRELAEKLGVKVEFV